MVDNSPLDLSDELSSFISEWKERPGNLIMILHKVQDEYKYVPRDVAFEVARRLEIPLAKIYGVLTFYHFFKIKKPGEHNLQVCMGTACYLKGAEDLIHGLEDALKIKTGETSPDGKFSIEAVRCVGCCGLAPVLTKGGDVHGKLNSEKLLDVVKKYKD